MAITNKYVPKYYCIIIRIFQMYCIFNRAKVNLIDGRALSQDPSRYRKPQEDIDHTLSADNKFIQFLNRTSGLWFLDNGAGGNRSKYNSARHWEYVCSGNFVYVAEIYARG